VEEGVYNEEKDMALKKINSRKKVNQSGGAAQDHSYEGKEGAHLIIYGGTIRGGGCFGGGDD